MKKLLLLLFLIPNLVMGNIEYLDHAELNEQFPSLNIKDYYNKDLQTACPDFNVSNTEIINTGKKFIFKSNEVSAIENKIEYTVESDNSLLIAITRFEKFIKYSADLQLEIVTYTKKSKIPLIELTVFETSCKTASFFIDPTKKTKVGETQFNNIYHNNFDISLSQILKNNNSRGLRYYKIDSLGYDEEGFGIDLSLYYPYAEQNKNTDFQVICESCTDKKTLTFSLDLSMQRKKYEITKTKQILRKKQLTEEKEIFEKKKSVSLPKINSLREKIDSSIKGDWSVSTSEKEIAYFCTNQWRHDASNQEIRDRGFPDYLEACNEYHPELEVFLSRVLANYIYKKEAGERKIQNEKIAKKKRAKRAEEQKNKKINNLKIECEGLGFKPGTKKFKDCVVELME